MKTNFKSKLFEKQIDLKDCNEVMGGGSGCSTADYSYDGGCVVDTRTTYYDECGNIVAFDRCDYAGC